MKFIEKLDIPRNGLKISGIFAVLVLGSALNSAPVQAQDQAAPDQDDSELVLEEVIVSGTRRALQNSIDIKRQATGIVDALSIGDIGDIEGRLLIPTVISNIALEGSMTPETAAEFLQEQVELLLAERSEG